MAPPLLFELCASSGTGSEMPVPRLSNMIRRVKDANEEEPLEVGLLPLDLHRVPELWHVDEVSRTLTEHLVRDMQIADPCVAGGWTHGSDSSNASADMLAGHSATSRRPRAKRAPADH